MQRKKAFLVILSLVLLVAMFSVAVARQPKSIGEITPVLPVDSLHICWPEEDGAPVLLLTGQQLRELMEILDTYQYRKLGTGSNLSPHTAEFRYSTQGKTIEIIFSQGARNSLMVNPVESGGRKPYYEITPQPDSLIQLLEELQREIK